ncbi:orotidine-5'-phosphate decarboxylase [Alicyclobacillus cycloheptanicus]|nr:orotidine-5'-phosphate decarboxylase [Alicyclobacillus cycloheptanicus]
MGGCEAASLGDAVYDLARRRTYLALDAPRWADVAPLVERLGPAVTGYKVGLELFHGDGPRALGALRDLGKRVFLDVKLHDIPNTVAGALRVIRDSGVEMVNVHALGGRKMLLAAREALGDGADRPLLVGVTVLTSLVDEDLVEAGYLPHAGAGPAYEGDANGPGANGAARLAEALTALCVDCGLDGVVTSARELARLRTLTPDGFEFVVPGTRPQGAPLNDQARSMTPGEAAAAGATRLVVGRAVTQSRDPLVALKHIWDEVVAHGT